MPLMEYFVNCIRKQFLFSLRLTIAGTLIYYLSNLIFTTDNILQVYKVENFLIQQFPDSIFTKDFGKLRKLYQTWPPSINIFLLPVYSFLVQYIVKCHFGIKHIKGNILKLIFFYLPFLSIFISILLLGPMRVGEMHFLIILLNCLHNHLIIMISTFCCLPWEF
uniref:Mannosyltransferase n=1 Tax=Strongyloides papillosus TaxID=174720 RepID=A0A0N5BPT7_STREA